MIRLKTSLILPALEWSSVEGADSYTLHINVDGQPELQVDVLVESTTYTVSDSLAYGTSYEWKVQGVTGSIEGEWSELRKFKTEQPPEEIVELSAPSFVAPAHESENISLLPALEWSAVEGAESYTLHINVDGQPDVQVDVIVEGTTYTVSDSLAYGTSYEWKVQGRTGSVVGEWSKLRQFTTEPAPEEIVELSAPSLVAPAHESDNISTQPTFEWTAVEGADSYILHMSVAGQPGEEIDVTVEGTIYTVSDSLEHDTPYVWRVRGVAGNVDGAWSDLRQFTTEAAEDSGDGDDVVTELPVPALVAPGHESENISTQPTFEWAAVERADYYVLHINKLDPEELVMYKAVDSTSFTSEVILEEGVSYSWRVRAVSDTLESAWSELQEFTTGVESDDGGVVLTSPALISPSNHTEFETLLPTFEWEHVDAEYYVITVVKSDESLQKVNQSTKDENETVVILEEVPDSLYTPEYELEPGTNYSWRVKPMMDDVEGEWSDTWDFKTPANQAVSNEPDERAFTTDLYQNYPNPFNPSTQIEFTVSSVQNVSLKVYDLAGREVAKLADEVHRAGRHSVTFNAGGLASGIYFYRFITDSKVVTKKMTLVK